MLSNPSFAHLEQSQLNLGRPRFRRLRSLALLSIFAVQFAPAQPAAPPFTLRVLQNQNLLPLADGSTLTMPADAIGQPAFASLTVTYRGTASAVINSVEQTGSLEFNATPSAASPFTLAPGESFSVGIRYLPTSSNRTTGSLAIRYTEGRTTSNITLNLVGTAPELAFSYTPQGGNSMLLTPGAAMAFPTTAIGATSNAIVVITNRGSGAGLVNSITAAGPAFQLVGVPLPNTTVEAGKDLRFTVGFTPTQLEPVSGSLSVQAVGRQVTFGLQGSGAGPVFAYELAQNGEARPLAPGQPIAVPDVAVGEKSSIVLRVRNTGNADARITAIAVQGAGFQLVDVPFLPLTLAPGASAVVTLQFTPAQAGAASGRLRVGDDSFEVSGRGLGSQLTFAYGASTPGTVVAPNGSVFFPAAPVGDSAKLQFKVTNTGTLAMPINSISVAGPANVFAVTGMPSLPHDLAPDASLTLTLSFTPAALNVVTGTLRIDNQVFTLSGNGLTPSALPDYRFSGASGSVEPLQQPAVGLALTSAYPLRLNGTLTLAFNSEVFSNDPSVQFSTGGRTISFQVPANSTQAVFPDGSNQVRLQTGTVAGAITLTPSFSTEGGVDLTPAAATAQTLRVAQAAPQVLGVVISARTANSFTLQIAGYATSRSVTQLELQLTPASGESLQTTRVSLNVEPNFLSWYQSSQSQAFGSLFTLTVPLSLAGDVIAQGFSLIDTIQSLSVTLANRNGTSAARSVALK